MDEFTRGSAIRFVGVLCGTHPALLRLGAVVGVVGIGFLSALDEGGRELSLRGERAEDFAALPEEIGGTRKGGDGML